MPRRCWASIALAAILTICGGCGDDDDEGFGNSPCRYDPAGCFGNPGAFCDSNGDCQGGFCCTEQSNCGGGMCTFACNGDQDCPSDMACEHDRCFFICRSSADCAEGQSCEHDNTVCEWP